MFAIKANFEKQNLVFLFQKLYIQILKKSTKIAFFNKKFIFLKASTCTFKHKIAWLYTKDEVYFMNFKKKKIFIILTSTPRTIVKEEKKCKFYIKNNLFLHIFLKYLIIKFQEIFTI